MKIQMAGEAEFKRAAMNALRKAYGSRLWYVHIRGGLGMRSGLPDTIIAIDGTMITIEWKNPNGSGRLGPKQKLEIEKQQKAGVLAIVAQKWEDLDPIWERFQPTQQIMSSKGGVNMQKKVAR